jgi:GrpB-like predicted nucleotidyltransferase (UPF0157 family)
MNEYGKVIIKEYDPKWPSLFEAERNELMEAIGHYVADIQHFGSTAVVDLAAKPVIDIMIGLRRLLDAQDCIMPIEAMGYEYLPELELEAGFEDRRYFRKSTNGIRSHQIHMVEINSDFWKRHLRFRDHLRSNPQTASDYAALKKELAKKFEDDRERYTNAKTDFITGVLKIYGIN